MSATTTTISKVEQNELHTHAHLREQYSEAFAAVETSDHPTDSKESKALAKKRDDIGAKLHTVAEKLRKRGYTLEHDDSAPENEEAPAADDGPVFTKAMEPLTSKKWEQVSAMLDILREADETPISFNALCEQAEVRWPQDVQAAMFALEMVEQVSRYTFTEGDSTKAHLAYRWVA